MKKLLVDMRRIYANCPEWVVRIYRVNRPQQFFGVTILNPKFYLAVDHPTDPENYDDVTELSKENYQRVLRKLGHPNVGSQMNPVPCVTTVGRFFGVMATREQKLNTLAQLLIDDEA